MGGEWIARPLSSKKKAQILDIREDWGALLAARGLQFFTVSDTHGGFDSGPAGHAGWSGS
jgi:hypothetical protein